MDDAVLLAGQVREGDPRATARLISMVEREDPSRLEALKALHAFGGRAHIIGITGPPGSGKSTLTDKLVAELRARNRRVAVAAIDPSSPFTGGAILGDRIRMNRHATDEGVFIRSLATRGHLGGLSRACSETVRVLDAAGYDDVIIETVGVGQSEVDVVRLADTVVLVSVPGLGDDIQAIKAGVMEIGDVFCVNKADKDGAERVVREIRAMLETAVMNGASTRFSELFAALSALSSAPPLAAPSVADVAADRANAGASSGSGGPAEPDGGALSADAAKEHFQQGAAHHIAKQGRDHGELELPPVLTTIAETGQGIRELVDAIKAHEAGLAATGLLSIRRRQNLSWELGKAAANSILSLLEGEERRGELDEQAAAVLSKDRDFYEALDIIRASLASRS
jgi:LAO/AO transport system kinase